MPVAKLDNAPRCQHTKLNGQPCSAPARRHRKYCVFHEAAHAKRPDTQVRLIDDAMSLQFALFQVMRSLDDQTLDTKRAALKLYALQIAASNLKRLQQEIEYNPHNDPAREMSLLETLMENFHIPEEEREFARTEFSAQLSGKEVPQENDPNLPPPPRFNLQACIDPHPAERLIDRETERLRSDHRQPRTFPPPPPRARVTHFKREMRTLVTCPQRFTSCLQTFDIDFHAAGSNQQWGNRDEKTDHIHARNRDGLQPVAVRGQAAGHARNVPGHQL